jgi:NADPH2:quinone reductase
MPETMRAVVCKELGPPDALVVESREVPEPGPKQVRVAMRAAGVNYVDGLIAAGRYQVRIEAPFVPGSEIAGEIDAVGEGVDSLAVGDRVFVSVGTGGFAERVIARDVAAVKLPPALDFPRAASFHQSYCTAWFALVRRTVVRPDETVLVTGAGGGVGLAAIDVAKSLGARVIAVASTEEKRALAKAVGADDAIDSADDVKTRARELTDGQGVDIVYDVTGGDTAEAALRALRFDGRFCVIGFTAGIPRIPLNLVLLNNRTVVGVEWGGWAMRNPAGNTELVHEVLRQIEAGKLHPVAPEARPLEGAASAVADLLERRAAGKIVLIP